MENGLIPFEFEAHPVRVVMVDDAPWWIANDLAELLGYSRGRDMVRMLDDAQKGAHEVRSLGGSQRFTIVSEGGMWKCVIRSQRPEAERLVRWLADEVLPALRRTGRYVMPGAAEDRDPVIAAVFDPAALAAAVAAVNTARRLGGVPAGIAMWTALGLPDLGLPLIDHADGLADRLADWLAPRAECALRDVMEALGFAPGDFVARRRVSAMLRALGWESRALRRGHGMVKLWRRATRTA